MHRTFMLYIGTAGWSLPTRPAEEGTHLFHYSRALLCAEINSSFYRPHRATTWAKWAAEAPKNFRFSIKAPKTITHEAKLCNAESLLTGFLEQIKPLNDKTGPILFQLPPSLVFEASVAGDFLVMLRVLYKGEAVVEPRHGSWFTPSAGDLLKQYNVARAAADPAKAAQSAAEPGGDSSVVYYRLHGSPRTYYSNYEDGFLTNLAAAIRLRNNAWVIFDNTALSRAFPNALRLQELVAAASAASARSQGT